MVLIFFLNPLIGKGLVKFGERNVLTVDYLGLIIVFSGYALVETKYFATILYTADHIFFNCAVAIKTFFQKIAAPTDIAPSMAVGFSINHIAAVVLPALGGLLWMIDYRISFIAGAVLSHISLFVVQLIPAQIKKVMIDK